MAAIPEILIHLEQAPDGYPGRQALSLGLPLARGLVFEPFQGVLIDTSGQTIPCQGKALGYWPDRSIKWLLLDFFASLAPGQKDILKLQFAQDSSRDIPSITVSENLEQLIVDTGSALFTLPKSAFKPFSSVRVADTELMHGSDSIMSLRGRDGKIYQALIEQLAIETQGPLKTTLLATGKFISGKLSSGLIFKSRLIFHAGMTAVRIEFLIRNPQAAIHPGGVWDLGDPGSILFEDLSLEIMPNSAIHQIEWQETYAGEQRAITSEQWRLYQDSSGGENWYSVNHIDSRENLTVNFRGYRVETTGDRIISEGWRAQPMVKINTSTGWIATIVERYWQNFPKALRVQNKRLGIGLFPSEHKHCYELQGGEQKRHGFVLEFGLTEQISNLWPWHNPIHAYTDPDWIAYTKAIPYFQSRQRDTEQSYLGYIDAIIDGPHSFSSKREIIDEYGWRHYGDLYADHEAVGDIGKNILVSHYNNQYDFLNAAVINYLKGGDNRWRELIKSCAEHTIDIDIYHTQDDKPAYNGGMFWHTDHYMSARTSTHRTYSCKNQCSANYGGGPDNEHNYTSGLLGYFYLTGDPEAAESIFSLADWVIAMDDGSHGVSSLLHEGPTGRASKTVDKSYHKPGRGAGNSINALLDAYCLGNSRFYLAKAEELIQRCIHPQDNIPDLQLDDPEYRWSYLVFLQVLGKYLDLKIELRELDYLFFYARDSLLHYADWMANYEVPYKDVLHKVKIPTETWSAQDIRKSHVFYLAAYYGPTERRQLYKEKAGFFFNRALNDLLSFNTAFLTRPMVIMAATGYVHDYFKQNLDTECNYIKHGHDFAHPRLFLGKDQLIPQVLRRKLHTSVGDIKRLSRLKWRELAYGKFTR